MIPMWDCCYYYFQSALHYIIHGQTLATQTWWRIFRWEYQYDGFIWAQGMCCFWFPFNQSYFQLVAKEVLDSDGKKFKFFFLYHFYIFPSILMPSTYGTVIGNMFSSDGSQSFYKLLSPSHMKYHQFSHLFIQSIFIGQLPCA